MYEKKERGKLRKLEEKKTTHIEQYVRNNNYVSTLKKVGQTIWFNYKQNNCQHWVNSWIINQQLSQILAYYPIGE